MSKRAVVNLVLLALVSVLAAVAYLQPGTESGEEPETLTALRPAQIERLEIVRQDGERLVFSKGVSGWEIERPIEAAANEFRIEPLLEVAQARSYGHFEVDESGLARYGFARPSVVLRLNGTELRFGDSEPIDHRRYVMIGDTVHLIQDRYFYRARSPVSNFVSLRLLPPGAEPVAISLPKFSVGRDADGRWRLDPPAGTEVSLDDIDAFVDRWVRAQAVEVTPYGGDAGDAGRIVISMKDGAPLEFLLIDGGSEPVLARPDIGMSYHLAERQGERLLQRPGTGAESED